MNLRKLFYLMLIIPMFFFYTGCSDDDPVNPPETVNETEILAKYLQDENVAASFGGATKVLASEVFAKVDDDTWEIIDIRGQEKFDAGHIKNSHMVLTADLLSYYETNSLQTKAKVVLVCNSGQTASWANALLHMLGYDNSTFLLWGLSSWNESLGEGFWQSKTSNALASQFVQTETAKPAEGSLPTLSTGKTTAEDILRVRVEEVFAEGFGKAIVSNNAITGYHVANYWNTDHYNWGHISGAMHYAPSDAFYIDYDLKTLPADGNIAVYCYTGQTSAHVAAYLRVLGYDAKSIAYGVNGMAYDDMPGTKFTDANVGSFPLVQ